MINIVTLDVQGFFPALRGMRNPKNSHFLSDSFFVDGPDGGHDIYGKSETCIIEGTVPGHVIIGENDYKLSTRLANLGPVHGKFRRMIKVWADITAPLYWWKEFDTYKVGTVANSCSTMHTIHEREITMDDFSTDHMSKVTRERFMVPILKHLNYFRELYKEHPENKAAWWQIIQLLPSSYNQTRTVELNYEVLADIYQYRRGHKLDEWRDFIKWSLTLPYPELFTGEVKNGE